MKTLQPFILVVLTIATSLIVTAFVLTPTWLGGLESLFFVAALIKEVLEYFYEEEQDA